MPSYEEYARLADAKAAGANSSAHIMITGHLAPPPASAGGYRVRRQDVEWKCTSCGIGPAVGRVWTASSASQHRCRYRYRWWCRQCLPRASLLSADCTGCRLLNLFQMRFRKGRPEKHFRQTTGGVALPLPRRRIRSPFFARKGRGENGLTLFHTRWSPVNARLYFGTLRSNNRSPR